MIYQQGKEYCPLGFGVMIKDGKTYYDRSERKKNYIYLDLSLADSPDSVRDREPEE